MKLSRRSINAAFPGIRAAVHNSELTLEVYGDIGESFWGDGVTAPQVSEQLQAGKTTGVKSVKVRINSPGGDCFEGVTIYNLLRSCGLPVTTVVDGLAASAASIIAMAGDKIQMAKGTLMMIHPAACMAFGDATELRKTADVLEKVTGQVADIYSARTGQATDDVLAMMQAETWMTPEEAVKYGFANETTEDAGDIVAVAGTFDLSVFNKVPESLKSTPETETETETEPVAFDPGRLKAQKRLLEIL
jgi:ATP-dependent Clp protease, protease subunit